MTQYFSLIISVILVLALIYLMKTNKDKRFFYSYFVVSFIAEVGYYLYVLFGERTGSHDLSATLRMFQTIMFGSPFLFDAIEKIHENFKIYMILHKVKNKLKK